ncbi:Sec23-binding domain of Sec16-domain-containing protein [Pisolithus sp. B1]|nr:Sec23-binding domain of Sec16-domain-containing protein [Pisolithus sp. B1]
MSSVEAAASLFGLEGDAGPDPFAVIGNEDTDTTQATGSNIEQQLAEHAQCDTSSCLVDMGQDASSLFAEQMYPDAQASGHDAWSLPPSQDSNAQVNGTHGPYVQQQSWYSDVHSTGYEPRSSHTSQPVRSAFTSDHDPYRPSPEGHRQPSSAPSYAQAQPPYDPYKPSTTTAYTHHTPVVSGAQITRESYKPISRSVSSPYAPTSVAPPLALPPQPVAEGNTPPAATTAASYRPKTSNAYDPPLPPPRVAKRAVSARTPRSASPATGHQTHGQTAAPPVPPLPPTVTIARNGSSSTPVGLPPRPASQQQVVDLHRRAENYGPMPYQNGITYVPPSVKELGPLPREPPVSRQVPPVRPTAVSNKYTPDPSQDTYSDNVIEDSLRHVSNDSLSCNTLETNGVSQDHDVFGEQLESQTVYTSDDMPWRDPEDGGFESGFPQSGAVSSSTWPAASAKYGSSFASDYSPHQPAKSLLDVSSREPGLVPAGSSADDFTQNAGGIHVASHLGRLPHRQGSSVTNGRASPATYSAHARTASSGSSISSLRSPVNRVSSPLRNAVDSNGHDPNTPAHAARAVHPYDPSPYASVQRASSQASVRSLINQATTASNVHGAISHNIITDASDRSASAPGRTTSPSTLRSQSSVMDPYAPSRTITTNAISQLRGRQPLGGSALVSGPVTLNTQHQRNELGPACQPYSGEPNSFGSVPAYAINPEAHMTVSRPAYAPSPSLLGSNDPLGRVSARAPIVSFGFGGKLVTCFHGSADLSTGFDVALSSRRTTNIAIREVHQVLPEYALEPQAALYPGPLFSDPGSPVTSLVRTGMSSNLKTKKARVIKYLEERAVEMSRGATYASEGFERRKVEDKLALVQVLKAMVEYDGVLHGSPQIDSAIRAALVPYIGDNINEAGKESSASLSTSTFTPPFADGYSTSLPTTNETLISVTATRPSALDKIQEFLVRGERRQAYHYALDEKLWAHAMVISSSIDKEAWKEVVGEFLKAELGVHDPQHALVTRGNDSVPPRTNGRECLRVVYSLFSGQGPAAIQELVPINLLSRAPASLKVPAPHLPHVTPMSPNFPSAAAAAQVPSESLLKWPEIVASVLTNVSNPEWSAAITALGDYLLSHQQAEAAHVCYMLSPQTSIIGGIGSPSARIILLGSQSPHSKPTFCKDFDATIFSEILEFAFSLKATPKGQEPFLGFPHLQAYKLIRAVYLAEIGHVQAASRYCEAITASMSRPSPYFNPVMIGQLRSLAERLIGAPDVDKSGSWISGKVNKPSLDSIGSWLEGRLTKFIAGEGDESFPSATSAPSTFSGPAPYSSMPSAATSASSSPPPMMPNGQFAPAQPPRRTGSAMSLPSTQSYAPIDRASSAMEHHRPAHSASPAPPKTAPLQPFYPFSPYTPPMNGHATTYVSAYGSGPTSRKSSLEVTPEESTSGSSLPPQERARQESGGWWDSLSNADSSTTPVATAFVKVDGVPSSGSGLVSLMDDPALSATPSSGAVPRRLGTTFEDEEDDLGLSNSTFKKPEESAKPVKGHSPSPTPPQEPTVQTEDKSGSSPTTQAAASGSSWFSRFWKRSETPGPVKANLGEETSFYYDKELKRWVNKKAGAEGAQPVAPTPPPPVRAQTASPSQARRPTTGGPPIALPLARTASAIDLTSPKPSMRPRSNLVPPEVAATPTTPNLDLGAGIAPPPMGRPRSQAAKKNVRSRYVDVFQQEAGASAA